MFGFPNRGHSLIAQPLCVAFGREYRELVDSLRYPDEDARSVALRNVSHLAGAGAMILNVLDAGTRRPEQDVRALPGVTTGAVQVAVEDLGQVHTGWVGDACSVPDRKPDGKPGSGSRVNPTSWVRGPRGLSASSYL